MGSILTKVKKLLLFLRILLWVRPSDKNENHVQQRNLNIYFHILRAHSTCINKSDRFLPNWNFHCKNNNYNKKFKWPRQKTSFLLNHVWTVLKTKKENEESRKEREGRIDDGFACIQTNKQTNTHTHHTCICKHIPTGKHIYAFIFRRLTWGSTVA